MQHRAIGERIRPGGNNDLARILVTGAAGFIGRALCPALAAEGHRVVAGLRREAAMPHGVETAILGDIGPATGWSAALRGIDIVHPSRPARPCRARPGRARRGTRGRRRASPRRRGERVKRLVLLSSVKAMGEATPPGRPFRADHEPRPQDAYARTKLASERAAAGVAGIELVIIRPPLVYGRGAGEFRGADPARRERIAVAVRRGSTTAAASSPATIWSI